MQLISNKEADKIIYGFIQDNSPSGVVAKQVERHLGNRQNTTRGPMRTVDAALQRLRKQGRIVCNERRWVITHPHV